MKLKDKNTQKFDEKHIVRRFAENYLFRTKITFALSTATTIAMAVFNATTGIIYQSLWYGSMAIYFIALMLVRIVLLVVRNCFEKSYNENQSTIERKKQIIYLIYGILILLLVAALTGMLIQMVAANKPIKTGMIIAIANAAYAFAKMGMAIYNLVKAKVVNDTLLKIIRNIGIVDSAVSMLALAVTLVTTFGGESSMRPILLAAAVIIAVITIFIGGFMIVKGSLRLIKKES